MILSSSKSFNFDEFREYLNGRRSVEWYIRNLEDINVTDSNNMNILHYICKFYKKVDLIEYVVNRGIHIHHMDNEGWTPLHVVCLHGTSEMIKYVIDLYRDEGYNDYINRKIEIYPYEGYTPIQLCCVDRFDRDLVEYMIESGADINIKNSDGWNIQNILDENKIV